MRRDLRWQDWITAALGVILFITPFVFADQTQTAAAWTAWVGGVLLFVFGAGELLEPGQRSLEVLSVMLGVLLFLSPRVLSFTAVTGLAWSAWVIGVLAFVSAGSVLTVGRMTSRSVLAR